MIFYTVDRKNSLKSGSIINLSKFTDITPQVLQHHLNDLFPEGVSRHGDQYFAGNFPPFKLNGNFPNVEGFIELLFEYVRKAYFPDRPSRFQSMYGLKTVEMAELFKQKIKLGDSPIKKIKSDKYFRADMSLLNPQESTLAYSYNAHKYWKGEAGSDNPFWEYLLSPPIEIL